MKEKHPEHDLKHTWRLFKEEIWRTDPMQWLVPVFGIAAAAAVTYFYKKSIESTNSDTDQVEGNTINQRARLDMPTCEGIEAAGVNKSLPPQE